MNQQEKKDVSFIGRLISLETFIVVAGAASLIYGFYTGAVVSVFYGVIILVGAVVLGFVRKKDWKKHWEEQERMQRIHLEHEKRRKERKDAE
ncbi:MAG TPA: hypothetical protein VNX25_04830 [Verrucomicrobiae bacterium]|nr:hypothetical protein [Verrucomicrobiae bacterium]